MDFSYREQPYLKIIYYFPNLFLKVKSFASSRPKPNLFGQFSKVKTKPILLIFRILHTEVALLNHYLLLLVESFNEICNLTELYSKMILEFWDSSGSNYVKFMVSLMNSKS